MKFKIKNIKKHIFHEFKTKNIKKIKKHKKRFFTSMYRTIPMVVCMLDKSSTFWGSTFWGSKFWG